VIQVFTFLVGNGPNAICDPGFQGWRHSEPPNVIGYTAAAQTNPGVREVAELRAQTQGIRGVGGSNVTNSSPKLVKMGSFGDAFEAEKQGK
jgi:hypothetical protein